MSKAVDARLFSSVEPLRLAGSRCTQCGTTAFPVQVDGDTHGEHRRLEVTLAPEALWVVA